MNDLTTLSAKALAKAIASKKVSARAVVDRHFDRIAAVNPRLNAVVQQRIDQARIEADEADATLSRGEPLRPLHGVPITIKDNLESTGLVSSSGTKGRAAFVPQADATVVVRLRAAGAIVLGRTNVPEFASAVETDNLVYGRTNNPYDLGRTPGGSSGGDAAIIAAGGSPLSVGTDAGGSIRIPAHFCGLAALKPTAGRIPRTGQFPPPLGARSAVFHISLISRWVEDLALALPLICGPDGRDASIVPMSLLDPSDINLSKLRVAFFDHDGVSRPTPDIAAAVQLVANGLERSGARVEEARPAVAPQAAALYHDISRGAGADGVRGVLKSIGTDEISPLFEKTLNQFLGPAMASPAEALGAFARWDMFRNAMTSFMQPYDAIISPVAPYVAFEHGRGFDDDILAGLGYSQMHNLTGWPALTLRVGTSAEGLPLGVQIAAPAWREDVVLAIGAHVEEMFGGWKAPPAA